MFSSKWYVPPKNGGYFMSKEHEYAAIGEFLVKQKEAEQGLAKLRMEARKLGGIFEQLGRALQEEPTSVVFDKESYDGRFSPRVVLQAADIDADRLRQLVNEYRRLSIIKEDTQRAIDEFKGRGT